MGSRISRAVSASSRKASPSPSKASPSSKPAPIVPSNSVKLSNQESIQNYEPVEARDPTFETKLHQLGDRIESMDMVFVPGSDPVSAEAKRKRRREMRQVMLKNRLTTSNFKEILIQQDSRKDIPYDVWIQQMAKKYEVDATLLTQALKFYRFPRLTKRYDGYLVSDPWEV